MMNTARRLWTVCVNNCFRNRPGPDPRPKSNEPIKLYEFRETGCEGDGGQKSLRIFPAGFYHRAFRISSAGGNGVYRLAAGRVGEGNSAAEKSDSVYRRAAC